MNVENLNVVLACPDKPSYDAGARPLATFYAELLGMRIIREDWLMIGAENSPCLAFGDGPIENYQPPRWPDPEHPQQLHLDIPVSDLVAADELVLRLGATMLQDRAEYRTYADPVGHPFCLYRDAAVQGTLSGKIGRIVIDCFNPPALAAFYAELLHMPKRVLDTPHRVVIAREGNSLPQLAFQYSQSQPPRWPDPSYPQQVHLDIPVEDLGQAQSLVLRLGATRLPDLGGSCPVYADPAGHPFCLCSDGQ